MSRFIKKEYIKLDKEFGSEPNFSKWLATDGIEYLKQALGVELISEGTEIRPNKEFSVDILMSVDPQYASGRPAKVVVENQYGRTDHQHFSKLITYAVANEAKYAVWIAEDIHPEHAAAIDWLNDNTSDNINFYVFKAVIEKIGENYKTFSLIPICEPKEELKIAMSEKKELSALNMIQLKFWKVFSSTIDSGAYPFKSRKAQPQHWYDISVGSSACHISVCMLSQERKCRLDLWIGNDKELYDTLFNKKKEIEAAIGRDLLWDRKEGSKSSSISYELPDQIDIYNTTEYDNYSSIILKELKDHFYKIAKFVR